MNDRERYKNGHGDQQPPGRHPPRPNRHCGDNYRDDPGRQPRVSDLPKAAIAGGLGGAPIFEARAVFIPG
jgi:hypothetical protein